MPFLLRQVAFNDEFSSFSWRLAFSTPDFIFFTDFVLTFFTAYHDEDKILISNTYLIAKYVCEPSSWVTEHLRSSVHFSWSPRSHAQNYFAHIADVT